MVCRADDPYDNRSTDTERLWFRIAEGKTVQAIGGNGEIAVEQDEYGLFSVPISSNEGILIIVK